MGIIVYDLDGTLRDSSCGDPYVPEDKSKPENWLEWQRYVNRNGEYLPTYRHYARDLAARKEVYILTSSQFGTAYWLKHSGLSQPDKIIERKEDDCRHPVVYKKEWIDKHHADVVKWVDDCKEVCDYIRCNYPHIEVVEVEAENTSRINTADFYEDYHKRLNEALKAHRNAPPPKKLDLKEGPTVDLPKKDTPLPPNKVVIFNGPPRSGKDLATSFCCEYFNGTHASLKEPLIKLTADFLGITVEDFLEHYDAKCNDKTYEEYGCEWVKDLPMYKVGETYLSKREALIHVSENVMKPSFGNDVFGKLAADKLPEGLVFFSDGGFPEEVQPLADKVGIENILIVHIKRDGCSFEGDSRNYVNIDGVHTVVVENDTLGKYLSDIAKEVTTHLY